MKSFKPMILKTIRGNDLMKNVQPLIPTLDKFWNKFNYVIETSVICRIAIISFKNFH